MAIQEGEKIPSVTLKIMRDGEMQDITTDEIFKGKKVVLFAVPGAFTPTCSERHLPGFIEKAGDLKARGVDEIVCMAVNDAFVMDAWGKDRGAGKDVLMVADGNAELTRALGLEMDASGAGLGTRSQRFALVADDGVVKHLAVEKPMKYEVSSADAILSKL